MTYKFPPWAEINEFVWWRNEQWGIIAQGLQLIADRDEGVVLLQRVSHSLIQEWVLVMDIGQQNYTPMEA